MNWNFISDNLFLLFFSFFSTEKQDLERRSAWVNSRMKAEGKGQQRWTVLLLAEGLYCKGPLKLAKIRDNRIHFLLNFCMTHNVCVYLQEWCRLWRTQEELKAREEEWKKERSFLQEQLNGVREELHHANLRVPLPNLSSH